MSSNRRRVVIGCPVLRREWCIQRWLEHITVSIAKTDLSFAFLFVGDPEIDPTFKIINEFCVEFKIPAYLEPIEEVRDVDFRNWGEPRVRRMVELRNLLLARVREMDPDYFFSLDSDILVAKDTASDLLQSSEKFDAVGGKAYMTRIGTVCPSYAMLGRENKLRRAESSGVHAVDVIMALKWMDRAAYHVDYDFDLRGEDIGWSKACIAAGLKLGFDGRIANKHVMDPADLERVDDRCGY